MTFNYIFEIAAVLLLLIVFYDYRAKLRVYRPDGIVFQLVILTSLLTSVADIISCILIANADKYSISVNNFFAMVFFFLQATMIFALAGFSFLYMNPKFNWKLPEFWLLVALFLWNAGWSVSSYWTGNYYHFDEMGHFIHGPLVGWEYYFYYINVLACLLYALYHHRHILKKDLMVAGWIAVDVCVGVTIQMHIRNNLVIGFFMAIAVLYLYMTLENPNDYQDKLTHCTNDYGFKVFIDSKCAGSKLFSILFLDIKKFRYINAIYGEEMGNYLLQQVVIFLEKTFRHRLVFRINNDVFALEIQGDQNAAGQIAEKIMKHFEEPFVLPNNQKVYMESVIATCDYPEHFQNHTELLELRSIMLEKVKGSHEGNIIVSDTAMADTYRRREQVEQALRNALTDGRLQVYYQPIFESKSETITTVEALSRLYDDKLGHIPPDEFIEVAEKTELIITLGFYVLEEVCNFIETRLLPDPQNTINSIHVNISTLQCVYPANNSIYLEIMKKHHVPPQMIQFEMTESTMVSSPDTVRKTMQELIGKGIDFALDDYGTGYSNISYLLQFPFDKVKFDKNMVWSYFKSDTARVIMENEFQILRTIGKDIVVEGIETKEQYETLRSQGIHLFQGYYFSKPVSAYECMETVHKWVKEKDAD